MPPPLHSLEQSRDTYTQCIGEHFDGVYRGVSSAGLDAGHVCPGESASISKSFLAHTHSHAELPDSGAELILKYWGGRRCWHSLWSGDVV